MMKQELPIDYTQLTKRYYTISEVAKMFDVSNSLIRHWESEIKQLSPAKSSRGDRKYTSSDIKLLERIHYLVRIRGFTLEGAEMELQSETKRKKELHDQIVKLEQTRDRLIKLRDEL